MTLLPIVILPKPNPSETDCDNLLSYANSLKKSLETVLYSFGEISSDPDEALILIRTQVEKMLVEVENMQSNLNTIKDEATSKMTSLNSGTTQA